LSDAQRNIDFLYDVELDVAVVLGKVRMLIKDVLVLNTGSVIELNKLAGEALEILVNEKVIARGEAVVVNEKFGVRLTEIVSPLERIQRLRDG
jgi:flagellar motor switch protein FliN/FliY